MSVNAGINVAFKRLLPKYVEYAGFAVSAPKKNWVDFLGFFFVLGKLGAGWSVNLKKTNSGLIDK